MIAAHGADAVGVFTNTNGTFAAVVTFPVGDGPEDSVAIGDLDGDGRLDLISTNTFTADLSLLRGTGSGFAAQRLIPLAPASFPQSVTTGDVDQDGDLDLVVAIKELDSAGVLLNDGAGNFAAALLLAVGDNPESIVVGDVNGDGRVDILSANAGSNDLVVILSAP